MNKAYEIMLEKNICMIIATSYENPINDIDSLTNELKKINYTGDILFDLLLCNGTKNRYIKTYFGDNGFQFDQVENPNEIDNNLKFRVFDFFQNNLQMIDNSILQNAQKFLMKKGMII